MSLHESYKRFAPKSRFLFSLILLITSLSCNSPVFAAQPSDQYASIIRDLCSKQVVLLGEDGHHGSGTTLKVKAQIVRRLITQCGFRGVIFETQFYDMLNYQTALTNQTATAQQLAAAVGPVWSRYDDFRQLATWLHNRAAVGRLQISGMAESAGGIGEDYSLNTLPGVLAAFLPEPRRKACSRMIDRHNQWSYDESSPFEKEIGDLQQCMAEISASAGPVADTPLKAMILSYRQWVDSDAASMRGDNSLASALHESAMHDNFEWIRAHWPANTKILVWSAGVHVAKWTPPGKSGAPIRRLGSYIHDSLGDKVKSIGFSALSGAYGNVGGHGEPHPLSLMPPDSLEGRALSDSAHSQFKYLDSRQLNALGTLEGRALMYDSPVRAKWSDIYDGIVVLRQETAATANSP